MRTATEFLEILRQPDAPSDYVVTSGEPVHIRNEQHKWGLLVDDPDLTMSHEEVVRLAVEITTGGPYSARMADFVDYQNQRQSVIEEQSRRHSRDTHSISEFLEPARKLHDMKWRPDAFDFHWEIDVLFPDGRTEPRVFRCHVVFVARANGIGISIFFRTVYSYPMHPFLLGLGEPSKPLLSKLQAGLFRPGLILVAGPVGMGKTTTLSSLAGWIVRHQEIHLLTIDQPMECLYPFRWTEIDLNGDTKHIVRKGLVTQREVGLHTPSYRQGLVDALREVPNVIVLGEIRDRETLEQALYASTFGSLVLATLHSPPSVGHAFLKVVAELGLKPSEVAPNINCIIAQRLLPHADREEGLVLLQEWALPNQRREWLKIAESTGPISPQSFNSILPLGIDQKFRTNLSEPNDSRLIKIFEHEAKLRAHDYFFEPDARLHEQHMDGAILEAYWKRRLSYDTAAGAVADLERFNLLMNLGRQTTGELPNN